MLGDPDLLIGRRRPAFNRLLPSRLAPAAPALGAKSRRSAPICPALRLQHCTNLGSVYVAGKKTRLVYQHTAIEQRYGCNNRTRIDLFYLCVTTSTDSTKPLR
ncbi:hypothetical protein KUCAC02_008784 [Chaenocephalus aceratus]|uniref:Uncharacterized protein n=1 Tax=Chaenocephalus aceratus TaxID=36190 RepID=A0ACB9WSA9_CHAAC|nr:hypothetical protein KUCAC02_008784 [Chaenocephalus aceratus]